MFSDILKSGIDHLCFWLLRSILSFYVANRWAFWGSLIIYNEDTHLALYYTMKFFICSILSWLTSSNKLSGRRKNHLVKENLFLSQNNVWKKLSIFSRSPIFWKDTMSHCLKRFVYECNRYKFYGCYENNINFLIMILSEREIVIFVCFDGFKSFKSDKRNPSIFLL